MRSTTGHSALQEVSQLSSLDFDGVECVDVDIMVNRCAHYRRIMHGLWQTSGGWGPKVEHTTAVQAMYDLHARGYTSFGAKVIVRSAVLGGNSLNTKFCHRAHRYFFRMFCSHVGICPYALYQTGLIFTGLQRT